MIPNTGYTLQNESSTLGRKKETTERALYNKTITIKNQLGLVEWDLGSFFSCGAEEIFALLLWLIPSTNDEFKECMKEFCKEYAVAQKTLKDLIQPTIQPLALIPRLTLDSSNNATLVVPPTHGSAELLANVPQGVSNVTLVHGNQTNIGSQTNHIQAPETESLSNLENQVEEVKTTVGGLSNKLEDLSADFPRFSSKKPPGQTSIF